MEFLFGIGILSIANGKNGAVAREQYYSICVDFSCDPPALIF